MLPDLFEFAFTDDPDLPPPNAADHVLVRWLRQRLGRPPTWLEVLALRAGLRERARRQVRWAWWRRLRCRVPPRRDDLVADFLCSYEGQMLLRLLGDMAALVAQLALPDPWEGYDGRHPTAARLSTREGLRERVSLGYLVPVREQVASALAYAEWKLTGLPVVANGFIPEAAEFLAPVHAAAINAMSFEAVTGISARLRRAGGGEARRREILRELSRTGAEAMRQWPGIERRRQGLPLGIRPMPEDGSILATSPAYDLPSPDGLTGRLK